MPWTEQRLVLSADFKKCTERLCIDPYHDPDLLSLITSDDPAVTELVWYKIMVGTLNLMDHGYRDTATHEDEFNEHYHHPLTDEYINGFIDECERYKDRFTGDMRAAIDRLIAKKAEFKDTDMAAMIDHMAQLFKNTIRVLRDYSPGSQQQTPAVTYIDVRPD